MLKKAYEIATLTGSQVLLLISSDTGHVYTFATDRLQPLITTSRGKTMLQQCLNGEFQAEEGNVLGSTGNGSISLEEEMGIMSQQAEGEAAIL